MQYHFESEVVSDIAMTPVIDRDHYAVHIDAGLYEVHHTCTRPGPYRVWVEIGNVTSDHKKRHGEYAGFVGFADAVVHGDVHILL